MFQKYNDINVYLSWCVYWQVLKYEADNVGDYKTVNKFYDIVNIKFKDRIAKENDSVKLNFYNEIINSTKREYVKFSAYTI